MFKTLPVANAIEEKSKGKKKGSAAVAPKSTADGAHQQLIQNKYEELKKMPKEH
jgi:hypothetical protein